MNYRFCFLRKNCFSSSPFLACLSHHFNLPKISTWGTKSIFFLLLFSSRHLTLTLSHPSHSSVLLLVLAPSSSLSPCSFTYSAIAAIVFPARMIGLSLEYPCHSVRREKSLQTLALPFPKHITATQHKNIEPESMKKEGLKSFIVGFLYDHFILLSYFVLFYLNRERTFFEVSHDHTTDEPNVPTSQQSIEY